MPRPEPMSIRNMRREEVDLTLDWAAREGWNPGIKDAEPFYQADPSGFFVGEVDEEMAATGSLVSYPGGRSFAGLLIVRSDLRGRGHGMKMLEHLMGLGEGRCIGGDGVPEMVPAYLRRGFKLHYWNHRHQGTGGGRSPAGLMPAREVPLDDLVSYDESVFGAARGQFLSSFIGQEGTTALAVLGGERVRGLGAIRPCRIGHKIGPLFADGPEVAERLLRGLISTIPGQSFFLDVPEPNSSGMALARKMGLAETFRTARVYTGEGPSLPLEKVFGVTSFELG